MSHLRHPFEGYYFSRGVDPSGSERRQKPQKDGDQQELIILPRNEDDPFRTFEVKSSVPIRIRDLRREIKSQIAMELMSEPYDYYWPVAVIPANGSSADDKKTPPLKLIAYRLLSAQELDTLTVLELSKCLKLVGANTQRKAQLLRLVRGAHQLMNPQTGSYFHREQMEPVAPYIVRRVAEAFTSLEAGINPNKIVDLVAPPHEDVILLLIAIAKFLTNNQAKHK